MHCTRTSLKFAVVLFWITLLHDDGLMTTVMIITRLSIYWNKSIRTGASFLWQNILPWLATVLSMLVGVCQILYNKK